MFDKTKISLPNGMTIEGTPEQISTTLSALGYAQLVPENYYFSESKQEYLKIEEMNTGHLKNAILKIAREWVEHLHEINNPQTLIHMLKNGIKDENAQAMLKEYSTREEE